MSSSAVPVLVLASESPRRAQLLGLLGLSFEIVPARVDERMLAGEAPAVHAQRLAREKAATVAADRPQAHVIGSDTVVVVDGDILGKPLDDAEAVHMLLRLQGRAHTVATGVAVAHGQLTRSAVEEVRVWFRPFDEETARAYVRTGEPVDKAGAYGIQGYGAALVERIEGDFFAVMGLPLCRLLRLFEAMNLHYDFAGLRRK
jgi:septum formation protein